MISMITAFDLNGLIGYQNELPWRLPADLAYFRKVTAGHTVVMGRKTADSLHGPLPDRKNIILSREKMAMKGFIVENSIENIFRHYRHDNIFVIGGSQIYEQFLPYTQYLYATVIESEFLGDAYFPSVKWNEWSMISSEMHLADERNGYPYSFNIYKRIHGRN